MPKKINRDAVVKAAYSHREVLTSYAYTILRDWSLAEDAVQNSYIIVMNKWEDYQEGTNIFYWIRRIVFNKCMEMVRERKKETPMEEMDLIHTVAKTLNKNLTDTSAESFKIMKRALEKCISKLNSHFINMLTGFYWDGHTCEKLGSLYKKSANAIRLIISRVRRQLKKCIDAQISIMEAE
ncbi:sigma-70 family RNA polymerase sigma factor [Spirochaetota bacterium]